MTFVSLGSGELRGFHSWAGPASSRSGITAYLLASCRALVLIGSRAGPCHSPRGEESPIDVRVQKSNGPRILSLNYYVSSPLQVFCKEQGKSM